MARSSAEIVTYVFAIVNCCAMSFVLWLGLVRLLLTSNQQHSSGHFLGDLVLQSYIIIILSVIALLFSLLLLDGIQHKITLQIKLYFVFGVVQSFILPIVIYIMFTAWAPDKTTAIYIYIAIGLYYVFYPPILYMILSTFYQYAINDKINNKEPDHNSEKPCMKSDELV